MHIISTGFRVTFIRATGSNLRIGEIHSVYRAWIFYSYCLPPTMHAPFNTLFAYQLRTEPRFAEQHSGRFTIFSARNAFTLEPLCISDT